MKEKYARVLQNFTRKEILKRWTYAPTEVVQKKVDDMVVAGENYNQMRDAINCIVLWKLNRSVKIGDSILSQLNKVQGIKSPQCAVSDYLITTSELIKGLVECKGVRLPMASTILYFFNSDVFPIIDQRAYRALYNGREYKEPNSADKQVELYISYLRDCIVYHDKFLKNDGIDFKYVDRFLYQLDKETGNSVKY